MNNQQQHSNNLIPQIQSHDKKTKTIKKSSSSIKSNNNLKKKRNVFQYPDWNKEQILKYLIFINYKKMRQYLQIKNTDWQHKAIKQMSNYIETKTFVQCVQFHQSMINKYKRISSTIKQLSKLNKISLESQQNKKLACQFKLQYKNKLLLKTFYTLTQKQQQTQFSLKIHHQQQNKYRFINVEQSSLCLYQKLQIDDKTTIQYLNKIFNKISSYRQNQKYKYGQNQNQNQQIIELGREMSQQFPIVVQIGLDLNEQKVNKNKQRQSGLFKVVQGQQYQQCQQIRGQNDGLKVQNNDLKVQYNNQQQKNNDLKLTEKLPIKLSQGLSSKNLISISDYSKFTHQGTKWTHYQKRKLLTFFIYNKQKFPQQNKQNRSNDIFKQMSMYIGTDKTYIQCSDKLCYQLSKYKHLSQDQIIQKMKISFDVSSQQIDQERDKIGNFYQRFGYSSRNQYSIKTQSNRIWYVDSFLPTIKVKPQNVQVINKEKQTLIKINEELQIYLTFTKKRIKLK